MCATQYGVANRIERLVRLIVLHGWTAEPVPWNPNVLLCTSLVCMPDGTFEDSHDLVPATLDAVRTWLGY